MKKTKALSGIIDIFDEIDRINEDELEKLELDSKFIASLNENALYIVEEREIGKIMHSIESVLLTIIFAIIANCNKFTEIYAFMIKHHKWLEKYIKYENGLPSIATIKRVVSFINPKEMEEWCLKSIEEFKLYNKPIYKDDDIIINDIKSMDGKVCNASGRKVSKDGKIAKTNAMSIMSIKNDYCEATEFIESKTNEIPTGLDLLKRINVENNIITFDAMSTQIKTIDYIVSKHGYYVAPVKGNQETLEENIKNYFADKELYEKAKSENYMETKEKAHSTLEKREYIFTNDINWLANRNDWKGLKSIGIAKRTYQNDKGEIVTDIRYYISNLDADKIKIISNSIREEWAIENKLHFYLDMVFAEDDNTSFVDNTQKNLNILRKFCLKILKFYKVKTKLSMNLTRFNISMDFDNEIKNVINTLYI